jgi:sensor histidine kinase YesM
MYLSFAQILNQATGINRKNLRVLSIEISVVISYANKTGFEDRIEKFV